MNIVVNKLLQWHNDSTDEKWVERVLFVNSRVGEFAVINMDDPNARPFFRSFDEMDAALKEQTVIPLETDFYKDLHLTESDLNSPRYRAFKERRNKAFKIIAPLFENDNAVLMLFERERAALINARAEGIRSWPKEERASVRTI